MGLSRVRLFGLTIASEIALPGLVAAGEDATPDVVVRRADLDGKGDIFIEEVGTFAVHGGREILVDAMAGVPERNVLLFLLGSAMGLLLHQRGLFPLHANAVRVGDGAIAVAGPSGAGKSTLAAWFHQKGNTLIGDDVVVVRTEGPAPLAYPGVPRFRLWGEAIERLGLTRGGLERAYVEDDFDKWDVPLAGAEAVEGHPLCAVYVIEDGPVIAIDALGGAEAVSALFDHTYRGGFVARTGGQERHWRSVTALAARVPVFRLARPRDLSRLDALGQALLDHSGGPAVRTGALARSR